MGLCEGLELGRCSPNPPRSRTGPRRDVRVEVDSFVAVDIPPVVWGDKGFNLPDRRFGAVSPVRGARGPGRLLAVAGLGTLVVILAFRGEIANRAVVLLDSLRPASRDPPDVCLLNPGREEESASVAETRRAADRGRLAVRRPTEDGPAVAVNAFDAGLHKSDADSDGVADLRLKFPAIRRKVSST